MTNTISGRLRLRRAKGLMRKGLAVRCLPVTAQDLGMVELPA